MGEEGQGLHFGGYLERRCLLEEHGQTVPREVSGYITPESPLLGHGIGGVLRRQH